MLRPYEYNPQKPGFLRPSLPPNQRAHRNPVYCLLTTCEPQKPGFFRPSLSPHQRAHRNPVSFWLATRCDRWPRNRVSLDHLCHPTEVLIETRFLFGWQRQCDRPFAPAPETGFL